MTGRALQPRPGDGVAAAALLGLTLIVVPGARAFLGPGRPLTLAMLAAAVMHVVPWATRRLRPSVGDVVTSLVYVLTVVWLTLGSTTMLGIPTIETWTEGVDSVQEALNAIARDPEVPEAGSVNGAEPSSTATGRMIVTVAVVALCAHLADMAAFRLRRPFVALAPSFTLLFIGAIRLRDGPGHGALAAYAAAALVFLAGHHVADRVRHAPPPAGLPPTVLALPGVAVVGGVAVAAGLVLGPHLPGYGKPPVVKIERAVAPGEPQELTLDPLVDIGRSLTQLSDNEVFVVESSAPAYWRLVSLDRFDGQRWTQDDGSGGDTDELVPTEGPVIVQEVEIKALRSDQLPAAYRPHDVSGPVELSPSDSWAVVPIDAIEAGTRYRVVSVLVQPSRSELARAEEVRDAALEPYLQLPADLPQSVVLEAERVVSEAEWPGPYGRAMALQDYFRTQFAYDITAPPGHDQDALTEFLFRTRRGYCEQFAAAYAAMARAVGLPARVAVGFTPGDPDGTGRYHVRGRNAHAWPEVFVENAGWVAFEPTPGRGMPGAEAYTGISPAQAGAGTPSVGPPFTPPITAPPPSTTVTPTTTPPATTQVRPSGRPSVAVRGSTDRPEGDAHDWVVVGLGALGVIALVAVAGLPLVKVLRMRRRRRAASGQAERVLVAWAEADEALACIGLARRPAETLLGQAARASSSERLPGVAGGAVAVLARRASDASYAGREPDDSEVAEARAASAHVRAEARRATSPARKVLSAFDPRIKPPRMRSRPPDDHRKRRLPN